MSSLIKGSKIQPFGFRQKKEDTRDPEYETPWIVFNRYHRKHHFTCDVCASPTNAKLRNHITKEVNALIGPLWKGVCWCNPPYTAKLLYLFVEKAFLSARAGATVVCLLPVWTDDVWFHKFCRKAEVIFLRRRITFKSPKRDVNLPAGFQSMIVIFRPDDKEARLRFADHPMKDKQITRNTRLAA